MKTKLFSFVLMLFLFVGICKGQPNNLQSLDVEATNVGANTKGVRLSVEITNSVMAVDSTVNLFVQITNASTNLIATGVSDPGADFKIYLNNKVGKIYKISREPSKNFYAPIPQIFIYPGKSHEWSIPVTVGQQVKPGVYELKVTKSFSENGNYFELVSNLLKVQIK